MEAEAIRNPQKDRKRVPVLLKGPPGIPVRTFSNRQLKIPDNGMLELSTEDADEIS